MPVARSWSSADFDALLARVMPDIVALLADGVPRSRATIVAALADSGIAGKTSGAPSCASRSPSG
jgi:hypothetical protein